ncbi:uncharacterized protein V2V93DRAFT_375195 [Kockiozyma suomiensis]|uniref:uncharacterized protein n=1 Tax=Kockiozyma suomiensis TaxID=1337062 RepID=UPI003342F0C6
MPDFSVSQKVAVVTGASRGLGLSAAKGLLEAGASKVYVISRTQKAVDEAAAYLNSLKQIKGKAIGIPGDFSKPEDIYRVRDVIAKQVDKVDIVIANAGATWGTPLETHPPKAMDRVLDLNIKGVFFTIQAFVGLLEKAGTPESPGRVIVLGSVMGIMVPAAGGGGTYGYSASKAAVHHMTKVLAVELGPRNICVNALAPGFFRTKMANGLIDAIGDEHLVDINPRGRLGDEDDLEAAIVFLSSRASNYVNGVVLPLDGGLHLAAKL